MSREGGGIRSSVLVPFDRGLHPYHFITSQDVLEVQSTSAQPRMEIDVAREKTFINSALLHEALEIEINEGNVLHYTAGWVAFKLKRRLEKVCSNFASSSV